MKNKKVRMILQIVVFLCIAVLIVDLAIIGITHFTNQGKLVYSTSVNQTVTSSDGYITVGSSDFKNSDEYSYTGGLQKAMISKYDYEQNMLWSVQYENGYNSIFNGVVEYENYYYAVGSIESTEEMSENNLRDALLVKYNRFGEVIDESTFQILGDSNFMKLEVVDGFLYVVGDSILPPMDIGLATTGGGVLVKYSTDLNEVWRANFGGAKSGIFNDLEITSDAIYVVGKDAANTGLIVKYDFNGNRLFVKNYEFTDTIGFSSVLIKDNNMFVGGSKGVDTELGIIDTEALLLSYDLSGNLLGGLTYDAGLMSRYNVLKIVNDELWAVGYTSYKNEVESTDDINVFNYDGIIGKYDFSLNELDVVTVMGNKDDYFTDILYLSEPFIITYSNSSDFEFGGNEKDFVAGMLKQ